MTTTVFFGHDYEKFSFINYAGKNIRIQTSVLLVSFLKTNESVPLKLLSWRMLTALPLFPLPLSKACLLSQLLNYT